MSWTACIPLKTKEPVPPGGNNCRGSYYPAKGRVIECGLKIAYSDIFILQYIIIRYEVTSKMNITYLRGIVIQTAIWSTEYSALLF